MKYARIVFIIVAIAIIVNTTQLYNKANEELNISRANEKALIEENSALEGSSRVLQFTVEQLEYLNDSITIEINKVKEQLKVKDKDLKQLQYLLSEAHKRDTIVFNDTIFINTVDIDTLIQDDWYKLDLQLRYPNIVVAEPEFISEKIVVINYRKETVNPPKKCGIIRLFQKKHNIVEVDVVDNSPYIINKKQRFIEIVK